MVRMARMVNWDWVEMIVSRGFERVGARFKIKVDGNCGELDGIEH